MMRPEQRRLLGLFGRALLLLPVFLGAWALAAGVLAQVAGHAAVFVLDAGAHSVNSLVVNGRSLVFEFAVESGGRGALAEVEVNSALYTFGITLFLALSFAVPESRRAWRIAAGSAVLLLLPAWGVAFDALRQLAFTAQLQPLLGWGDATRSAVALGFQVGSLLLPTLAPVVLWLVLNPRAWGRPAAGAESAPSQVA